MISQEQLKKILDYNQGTGIFTWINPSARRVKPGDIAGTNHTAGYRRICVMGKLYFAHRLAFIYMNGAPPEAEVDHINGDRTDNRWINLRDVERKKNCKNSSIPSHNTSGTVGVSWYKQREKWRSHITVDQKMKNLGYFDEFEDAVRARKAAEKKYGFHEGHGKDRKY